MFKPRRTNAHYIAFIEAITFYKQCQRESKVDTHTGELYIETTLEDIAEANQLMKHILLRKSDELSGGCRNFFEKLKQYIKANQLQAFTNKEIRTILRTNHNTQKMYMRELQQYNYIRKTEGDKKKGYQYEIVSYEEYEALQQRINNILDEILQRLRDKEVVKLEEVVSKTQLLKLASAKQRNAKTKEVAGN